MRRFIVPAAALPLSLQVEFSIRNVIYIILFLVTAGQTRAAAEQNTLRFQCPVVADTTVYQTEPVTRQYNVGKRQTLELGGSDAFALLRFDLSKLEGLQVTKATLRLYRVQELLVRVGVSTIAAQSDWAEGSSTEPTLEAGAACYQYAAYAKNSEQAAWWAQPGTDIANITFGNGGSRFDTCPVRFDAETRWHEIDIPPQLIQAMSQGLQPGGLCLSDDFGRGVPRILVGSRESRNPPQLIVEARRVATTESAAPVGVKTYRDHLGIEWLTFEAPEALGFDIRLCEGEPKQGALPEAHTVLESWYLPGPGAGLRGCVLSFQRHAAHTHVAVRAVEPMAQWSAWTFVRLPALPGRGSAFTAPRLPRFPLPQTFERPFIIDDGPALSVGGHWIRSEEETWWNPYEGPVDLQAARNEFVAFQVILAGGPGRYNVILADWKSPGVEQPAISVQTYRQGYIRSLFGREKYAPDVAIPIESGQSLDLDLLTPVAATQPTTQPQRRDVVQGLWIELYVPEGAARGTWANRVVVVKDGQALLDVPLKLRVVDATLSDKLHYDVALDTRLPPAAVLGVDSNAPEAWRALEQYHRLAHRHRATLGVIPYTERGDVQVGFAPAVILDEEDGPRLDWSEWDRRFARYFDGSAFRDAPRERVPLRHFYLPFHENWPMPFDFEYRAGPTPLAGKYHFRPTSTEIRPGARPGPARDAYMPWPIDEAFSAGYADGTRAVVQQAAQHLSKGEWSETQFTAYLCNGLGGGERSSWWAFDEPSVPDDFRALAYWLSMYRAGQSGAGSLATRVDFGLFEFERDRLDGLVGCATFEARLFRKQHLVLTSPELIPAFWLRPQEHRPELGWSTLTRQVWSARLTGAKGIALGEALADERGLREAAYSGIVYPGPALDVSGPLASLRLKALLRGQQDMEWIHAWVKQQGAEGVPEGIALAVVALEAFQRGYAQTMRWPTLLPNIQFYAQVETVGLEELRRGLRQAVITSHQKSPDRSPEP